MRKAMSGDSGQGNRKDSKRRDSTGGFDMNHSPKRRKTVGSTPNAETSTSDVSTTSTSSNGPENPHGSIIESPSSSSCQEDTSFTSNTSLTAPSRCPSSHHTHDTSRTSFHIKDLSTFATTLEEAAKSAFPNRGRSRYATVNVCLIRWAEDEAEVCQRVQPELERLCDVFQLGYRFNVEKWTIPSVKSHRTLMGQALEFIEGFDSRDNLFIVYYAGHGTINENRQSVWCCKRDPRYASVDWSSIQSLFDDALSDVLILLDCCAAASSANNSGNGTNETIAACGFEGIAPPPGPHSFTNMLVEVLDEWKAKPYFSVSLLHAEVLLQLKRKRPDMGREGRRMEWCRTPVHYISSSNPRPESIELSQKQDENQVANSPPYSPRLSDAEKEQASSRNEETNPATRVVPDGNLTVPHILISVALEEEQADLNVDSCRLWLSRFPALVKYAKVQGVFKSHSTLLLCSLPVVIWNMLPENPACYFIGFIRSDNLACKTSTLDDNIALESISARSPVTSVHPPVEQQPHLCSSVGNDPQSSIPPSQMGLEPPLYWPAGNDREPPIPSVKTEPHLHWPIGNEAQSPIAPIKTERNPHWLIENDPQPPIPPTKTEPGHHLYWPTEDDSLLLTSSFEPEIHLPWPTGNDSKQTIPHVKTEPLLHWSEGNDRKPSLIRPKIGGLGSQKSDNIILPAVYDQERLLHETSKQLESVSSASQSKNRSKGGMKRHERPYGCTFLTCNKTFGSKNDWKRHENSQHFHLETWRCDEERLEGGACAKVCYRRQNFQEHLVKAHQMYTDSDAIKPKLENCRIGRNCQGRFWCGFCNKLVDLKKRGVDAWTERFDHIDDHFMGRHKLPKQSIQDWIPMDSDKPKGEVESPYSLGSPDEDQALSGSSARNSPTPTATSDNEVNPVLKKRRSSSSDYEPSTQKRKKIDTVIYCCQCSTPHNPRIDLRCTGCPASPHEFCSNCKVERVPRKE